MVERQYEVASIEVGSPMTDEYRSTLLRLLADQARAELFASHMYSRWVPKAPGAEEKMMLAELAHEETEHWYRAVVLIRELGIPENEITKYQGRNLYYPLAQLATIRKTWLDILMAAFIIDRGAYFLVEDFAKSSYAPWSRASIEILEEEVDHVDFGQKFLAGQIKKRGKQRCQKALNKWWRIGLNMFGPPRTKNTDTYLRLGLKYRTNEDRRQAWRRDCEPRVAALGLKVPKLWHQDFPYL